MSVAQVDAVFVQPHFDDIALSCGGTVAACAAIGTPLIVTVFAGRPTSELNAFARWQHQRWGLDDDDVVAQRRAEDECAAAALGPSVETRWLDFLDAIYRDEAYSDDEALFGPLQGGDSDLVSAIANELSTLGQRFILPLGIGNHVDHQIVFEAGRELREAGHVVRYYADMPYALDSEAFRKRLAALGDPRPRSRPVAESDFEARWNAIQCYASQLPVIFRQIGDPRSRLFHFGQSAKLQQPVEMFWNPDQIEGYVK